MISAIVVNYHCAELTLRAVNSIMAAEDAGEREVLVVDNSVAPEQAEQLQATLPSAVRLLINAENTGFAKACNLAYRLSRGDLILLLNPDAYLLPGCLAQLQQALLGLSDAGGIGPQVYWDEAQSHYLPPTLLPSARQTCIHTLVRLHPYLAHRHSLRFRAEALRVWQGDRALIKVQALSGGHVLLQREAIEQCGGLFDERFFMYYEDSDLMLRLRNAGFRLYMLPNAACVHNYEHKQQKMQLMATARAQYFAKHYTHDPLLKLHAYLPKNPAMQPWLPAIDLGGTERMPQFDVPAPLRDNWLLEISPAPNFIPAIGRFGQGPVATPAEHCSQWLHPGRYFGRIGAPKPRSPYLQSWQWQQI